MNVAKTAFILVVATAFSFPLFSQDKPAAAASPAPTKQDAGALLKMDGCKTMHKMACRQLAVAPDGCVIVLIGEQLLKYDANLVLQKEVAIKTDGEKASGMPEKAKAPEAAAEKPKTPDTKAPVKK